MIFYNAGNFPLMVHPWKEDEFSKKAEELYGDYDRLLSFFFKPETEKVMKIKRERNGKKRKI